MERYQVGQLMAVTSCFPSQLETAFSTLQELKFQLPSRWKSPGGTQKDIPSTACAKTP
jgi:hypothetical protein